MNIVPVRGAVRPLAARWLRLLPAGALLACPLLSACSHSNTASPQTGWTTAKSWPGTVPALSLTKEPARSWTLNPGPESAAIGELPAVTVEAHRQGTCPKPPDRLAALLFWPAERRC